MTTVAFFDTALLATLPGRTIEPVVVDRHGTVRSRPLTLYGRSPFAHARCVQPPDEKRKPFTVGLVRQALQPLDRGARSLLRTVIDDEHVVRGVLGRRKEQ